MPIKKVDGAQEPPAVNGLPRKVNVVQRELNILALIKGDERYVFVYDDESRAELLDLFRDQAADPRVSFSWFDASLLAQKAREQAVTAPPAQPARY